MGIREGESERGSLVMGQVRWPASSHRWIEGRSKVWPEERMTGSDIISREIGHLKSSGYWVVVVLVVAIERLHISLSSLSL